MSHPILFSSIFFFGALGVGMFMAWPSYQELSALRQQVREKEVRVDLEENILLRVRELHKDLGQYQRELQKVDATLPEDPELALLYDSLLSFASSSGVLVESVSSAVEPPDEETRSRLTVISLDLTLSGSYEGLKQFLSRVKESGRVLNVTAVSAGTSGQGGELSLRINLEAYSY